MKNSTILTFGRVSSLLLNSLTLIILTRILSLEEYGKYVTIINYVNIFTIFTMGGMSSVILREGAKNKNILESIYHDSTIMKLIFILSAQLLCLIALLFTPYSTEIKTYIVFISFILYLDSFIPYLSATFDALEKFNYKIMIRVLNPLIFLILISFLIFNNTFDKIGYLMGFKLLTSIIIFFLCFYFFKNFVKYSLPKIKFKIDKKFLSQSFIFFLISLAGTIFAKSDVIMISFMGSQEEVGVYNIANRIAREFSEMRTVLLAGFFPVLIKRVKKGSIPNNIFIKSLLGIFILSLIGAFIFSIFSTDIITLIFGDKFSYSGVLLSLIIYYVAIEFSMQPIILLLLSSHLENIVLFIFGVLAASNIFLNIYFYNYYGLIGIAYSTLLVFSLFAILVLLTGLPKLYKYKIIE